MIYDRAKKQTQSVIRTYIWFAKQEPIKIGYADAKSGEIRDTYRYVCDQENYMRGRALYFMYPHLKWTDFPSVKNPRPSIKLVNLIRDGFRTGFIL
jgi:hypothetical protein